MESNVDEIDKKDSKGVHLEEEESMDDDHDMEEFDSEEDKAISSGHYIATNNLQISNEIETSGGSNFWIPNVEDGVKPILGSVFQSLDTAIEMYANYAKKGGFKIRRSTQKTKRDGSVILKYILCSKAGILANNQINQNGTSNPKRKKRQRNMRFQRTGCKACAKFKLIPGTSSFRLYDFEDKHNHALVTKDKVNLKKTKNELDLVVGEGNDRCEKLAHDAYSIVDYCIGKLSDDKEKLDLFVKKIQDLKNEVEAGFLDQRVHKKEDVLGSIIGISNPEVVVIPIPVGIRNEGSSSEKRLKGSSEKVITGSSKLNRMCKRCWKIAGHDSRNCPLKNAIK